MISQEFNCPGRRSITEVEPIAPHFLQDSRIRYLFGCRWATTSRQILQRCDLMLVEITIDPIVNCLGADVLDHSYFVGSKPLGDQQHGLQPLENAFIGCAL